MGEPTMEEYMTKTRDGYGGSDHEDANEHIEKVLEIVEPFHIPNITQDQGLEVPTKQILDSKGVIPTMTAAECKGEIKKVNEKVFTAQVGCELCKRPCYTNDCPLKEEGKTLEKAYYTQFGVPFQQGGKYKAATPGFYQRNNANPSYQSKDNQWRKSLKPSL
ncbi:hypothetical protein Tco_1578631 [Tanacetum coccineum]